MRFPAAFSPNRYVSAAAIVLAAGLGCLVPQTAAQEAAAASTQRWAFSAGRNAEILSSPAIGPDRTVYVGVTLSASGRSGALLAVKPNGEPKWTRYADGMFRTPGGAIETAPALSPDGSTVYVGCNDGALYAVNATDGTLEWVFPTGPSHAIYTSPAVGADGTIYIGSSDLAHPGDSTFYAVTPKGAKRWAHSSLDWTEAAPAIGTDGTIYYGSLDGVFYALDPLGHEKWRFETGGPIYSAAAIAGDGTIYVGSDAGDFYALSGDGKQKWRAALKVGAGAALGADGTIYVGTIDGKSSGSVHALAPDGTSRPKWPVRVGGTIETVPAVLADGTIIVGSEDRKIHALNPDGSERWMADIGDAVYSSPVVDEDGTIYVGASSGKLYSFTGFGSPLSTYSSWPTYNQNPAHTARARLKQTGGRLVNLATRGQAAPGPNLIAGLVVQGSGSKRLLVRAVGPSLKLYGVENALPNPKLTMRIDTAAQINDDWGDERPEHIRAASAEVGAFPLIEQSKDAAFLAVTAVGSVAGYTVVVDSVDSAPGVALVEVYDANVASSGPRLVNLSTRGFAGGGENMLIGGLVIGGTAPIRVLIRGVGPGLRDLGVPNVLSKPTIKIFQNSVLLASNTGWTTDGRKGDLAAAAQTVGAFPLKEGNTDSALMVTLAPGGYTVQLSGVGGETGESLVEVYALPE